jgi:hypothetical protein
MQRLESCSVFVQSLAHVTCERLALRVLVLDRKSAACERHAYIGQTCSACILLHPVGVGDSTTGSRPLHSQAIAAGRVLGRSEHDDSVVRDTS